MAITITREDFGTLLNALRMVSLTNCSDCDIFEGKVRQPTDNKVTIIQMDLSNIIGNETLPLSNITKKVELLKTFELDDTVDLDDDSVILEVDDDKCRFVDSLTTMTFKNTIREYMNNSYFSDATFDSHVTNVLGDLVMTLDVSGYMVKRIRNISKGFATDILNCSVDNEIATVSVNSRDGEYLSEIISDVHVNKVYDFPYSFKLFVLPFNLGIDSDMNVEIYSTESDKLVCKFMQSYFGIPVSIYIRTIVNKVKS